MHSISQDICYNATSGQWKTGKHATLSLSLHHTTGSSKIVTLLNRYGHCCSYSFVLECETALCASVLKEKDGLLHGILAGQNVTTHLCWDNWDLNEETLSGAGTINSTQGTVIQDYCEQEDSNQASSYPEVERTKL